MKVMDLIKNKHFLIGVGVGLAGFWAYNKYMKKETTSSADGDIIKRTTILKKHI